MNSKSSTSTIVPTTSKAQPNTSYNYPDKLALLDALAYIWSDDNDMFNKSEVKHNQGMLSQDRPLPSEDGGRVCCSI